VAVVRTLTGDVAPDELGVTLIHEHLVVDVRLPAERGPGYEDDLDTIVGPMLGHLAAVRNQGVRTVVDCTPTDVGQHLEAYRAVAARTGLRVVAAVGTYRDGWLPDWVRSASREQLADWYAAGLSAHAGFVKLGCDPDGPTPAEAACAAAAGLTSRRTGALVACHVGRAAPANRVIDAFEAGGGDPARFVVVHVQNEPAAAAHLALARRGAWVEYDAIGARPADDVYVAWLRAIADADLLDRVLISQDACAYMVVAGGRVERQHRFDHLFARFVPALRAAGFAQSDVDRLLVDNPARALTFDPPEAE
jgi:phosphotriesterase-related protein